MSEHKSNFILLLNGSAVAGESTDTIIFYSKRKPAGGNRSPPAPSKLSLRAPYQMDACDKSTGLRKWTMFHQESLSFSFLLI